MFTSYPQFTIFAFQAFLGIKTGGSFTLTIWCCKNSAFSSQALLLKTLYVDCLYSHLHPQRFWFSSLYRSQTFSLYIKNTVSRDFLQGREFALWLFMRIICFLTKTSKSLFESFLKEREERRRANFSLLCFMTAKPKSVIYIFKSSFLSKKEQSSLLKRANRSCVRIVKRAICSFCSSRCFKNTDESNKRYLLLSLFL